MLTTVDLYKDDFSFSAGHFTIFSATEREDLHGHNYYVSASLCTELNEAGLSFDYRFYKNKLLSICSRLDRKFLLAGKSRYLRIEDHDDMLFAHFNNERIPFLKRDALVLPITNVTIEELSKWFLEQLLEDQESLKAHQIKEITIKVYNGPAQSGSATQKITHTPNTAW